VDETQEKIVTVVGYSIEFHSILINEKYEKTFFSFFFSLSFRSLVRLFISNALFYVRKKKTPAINFSYLLKLINVEWNEGERSDRSMNKLRRKRIKALIYFIFPAQDNIIYLLTMMRMLKV